ncbi:unnamed protein product, partial [Iphiclides podalirius]
MTNYTVALEIHVVLDTSGEEGHRVVAFYKRGDIKIDIIKQEQLYTMPSRLSSAMKYGSARNGPYRTISPKIWADGYVS